MFLYTSKLLLLKLRKHSTFLVLLSFVFLFCSNHPVVHAQSLKVSASLDTNNIKIGDPVNLHLEIQHAKDSKIKWPSIPDSLTKIEVIKRSPVDTVKSEQSTFITERQDIKLICFDSGSYVIPSFAFVYKTGKDTSTKMICTDSLLLEIKNISVDTTQAIKDIKPPLEVPFSWKELAPYSIAGLIILAIAVAIYYFIKRRKKKTIVEVPEVEKVPAHEEALKALKKLENEKLWQQGNNKGYYSQLSDIVRTYIEGRYGVNAMEYTTDEILKALNTLLNNESKEKLRQVLVLADLVKFAKAKPIDVENDLSMYNASDFVNRTKSIVAENIKGKEEAKS